jgi:hypothetical protein
MLSDPRCSERRAASDVDDQAREQAAQVEASVEAV